MQIKYELLILNPAYHRQAGPEVGVLRHNLKLIYKIN